MTHATTPARAELDGMLRRRLDAMLEEAHTAGGEREHEQMQTAEELEATTQAFADACVVADLRYDGGAPVPYDDTVVIVGSNACIVVTTDDYDRERVYHEARAGQVDSITVGWSLLAFLRTGVPQ